MERFPDASVGQRESRVAARRVVLVRLIRGEWGARERMRNGAVLRYAVIFTWRRRGIPDWIRGWERRGLLDGVAV